MRILIVLLLLLTAGDMFGQEVRYQIAGTRVSEYYSDAAIISPPIPGEAFFGQDADYPGNEPGYTDNGDGTITDVVTGLMWQQEMGKKITYDEAFQKADTMSLGGFSDWRVPSIKELYSLIIFTGRVKGAVPYEMFIDTAYFNQPLGDMNAGERLIDAQTWSSTRYVGTTMRGDSTVFGVNFLDGRIKGYPKYQPGSDNTIPRKMYFRMVRGNPDYGMNNFVNNGDGTVTDLATGLMWQQADDGQSRDWEHALSYAEDLELAGHTDWRLPDAKELQSIVDYSRCPDVTASPAINPVFSMSEIDDPDGNTGQYPYFWTGTTHLDGINPYSGAVYVAFGEAQGRMNYTLMDVHGAGAQRSDPKSGNPQYYPDYFGPQGDVRYVFNFTRCVRNSIVTSDRDNIKDVPTVTLFPNPARDTFVVHFDYSIEKIDFRLTDVTGEMVKFFTADQTDQVRLEIGYLPPGSYFAMIEADGKKINKMLIKQ